MVGTFLQLLLLQVRLFVHFWLHLPIGPMHMETVLRSPCRSFIVYTRQDAATVIKHQPSHSPWDVWLWLFWRLGLVVVVALRVCNSCRWRCGAFFGKHFNNKDGDPFVPYSLLVSRACVCTLLQSPLTSVIFAAEMVFCGLYISTHDVRLDCIFDRTF